MSNTKTSSQSSKEWRTKNADIINSEAKREVARVRAALWRAANPDRASQAKKKCYEAKKAQYRKNQKAYYEENKSIILEKQKEYSIRNADKITARRKSYYLKNIEQKKALDAVYYRQNADKIKTHVKKRRLKRVYNLTQEQWDTMFESQNHCCAICKSTDPVAKYWHTDHCHTTGKVRQILCQPCNHLLGHASDDVNILKSAVAYLNASKELR